MPDETLTAKEIDELAFKYDQLDAEIEKQKETLSRKKDELIRLTQTHGTVPPRAVKSKRIEGEEWEVTVSMGQSVEINGNAVVKIRKALYAKRLVDFFARLFEKVESYKMVKGAQELMAKPLPPTAPRKLRQWFAEAVQINDKNPSLKVARKKKETP